METEKNPAIRARIGEFLKDFDAEERMILAEFLAIPDEADEKVEAAMNELYDKYGDSFKKVAMAVETLKKELKVNDSTIEDWIKEQLIN